MFYNCNKICRVFRDSVFIAQIIVSAWITWLTQYISSTRDGTCLFSPLLQGPLYFLFLPTHPVLHLLCSGSIAFRFMQRSAAFCLVSMSNTDIPAAMSLYYENIIFRRGRSEIVRRIPRLGSANGRGGSLHREQHRGFGEIWKVSGVWLEWKRKGEIWERFQYLPVPSEKEVTSDSCIYYNGFLKIRKFWERGKEIGGLI